MPLAHGPSSWQMSSGEVCPTAAVRRPVGSHMIWVVFIGPLPGYMEVRRLHDRRFWPSADDFGGFDDIFQLKARGICSTGAPSRFRAI
jgi:hypothetical protein